MERYIALLRGINISGKNKIAMPALKKAFEQAGYTDVKTHLNSGNVLFNAPVQDCAVLAKNIVTMIEETFQLDIPVFVILQKELQKLLNKAPAWWGSEDKNIYDNLIFVMHGSIAEEIADRIGSPSDEIEQIEIMDNAVFWSFDLAKHAKANWWKKTATAGIGEYLTIRTANTCRKIAVM